MNFTSLMGNVIDQGLLCQKAEATVQEAIAAINRGQKPVIAVANTMEAFIKQFAEDHALAPGDAIDISFGDVLSRYLERSRDVTIKDHEGKAIRRRMGDDELGPEALAAYDHARDRIEAVDLSTIPLSSIDYIKWRLAQEGYRIGEITGRQHIIDYDSTGEQGYGRRSAKETTPQAKVEVVDQFNRGDLDILVLNRSGATGINLHASEKFADQQQRHLIVAQAERDINQVMQMLGRVNRFGQVVEPEITLLMSDLPAEKRLGAILSKKMATLNANTTADRDSALSIANVVDFLNPYGEEVITEILEDRLELEAQLAYPSKGLQGDSETELISRVTGRIPLLSVREQEDLYHLIETETLDLIAQKQAMGESVLEAQQLDLDAQTIARMEVIPDDSTVCNEFTGPVYLDVVDAKIPVKPFSQLEVINIVREHLDLEPVQDLAQHEFDRIEKVAREHSQTAIQELRQAVNQHRTEVLNSKDFGYDQNKLTDRLKEQFAHVSGILRTYPPGEMVRVVSPEGNITYGVVARVWQKGHNGSPAAPTNWRAEILTDNQARTMTIPLTRFNRGKEDQITTISRETTNWEGQDIYAAFDLRQQTDRMERQIFQGNLLEAYEKYPNGKFVNFTDDRGQVCQGLIMPASFDIQESLRSQPVAFHEPHQVKAFLSEITHFQGAVKTLDEVLTLKTQVAARFGSSGDGFLLQTPKTAEGDRFSLNQAILAAAGSDFYSVSDRMELVVPAERIDAVLHILMKDQQQTLAAFDFKEKAREFLGIHLPEMKAVPQVQAVHCKAEEAVVESLPRPEIAPVHQQSGGAEKNVAKFLHQSGLEEVVLEEEDFHLRIEHEPYIPLVVERHNNALFLTHYLEQNGDLFIDAELVLQIDSNGQLHLQETATQDPIRGGECRGCDRGFAQLFSCNLLQQGFAEAAQVQMQPIKDFLDSSPSPNDALHSSIPTMQDPNTTPPEAIEAGCEVIEQSTLFSMTQYESDGPVSSTTGLDQAWVAWEHKAQEPEHPEPQRSPEVEPLSTQTLPHHSSDWKQLADRVRDLPLADLAQQFGLEQDRSDKAKWRMNGFCLSINGSKFFDHYADKGGVGAIDFTMYVRDCSFREAVEVLSNERPEPVNHLRQEQGEKLPKCNIRDESRWEAARSYLTGERGLHAELVDVLHEKGLLSVDARQNVMFFRYQMDDNFDRGAAIGANLRGTIPNSVTGEFFKGLTPGTTREDGYFWFKWGEEPVNRVVIVESPIDALSYAALHEARETTVLLSTDGQGAIPVGALQQILDQSGELVLAHDHDRQGDRMAWQMVQQFPDALLLRETPEMGKDWNDQLLVKEVTTADSRQPIADQLWQWYAVATPEERATIAQIGIEFNAANKPRELTETELAALHQAISSHPVNAETQALSTPPLDMATDILRIAERAYAYGESIGRLNAEGDIWFVQGNDYTLSYDPQTSQFQVEGRNGMVLQSIDGAIDPESLETISDHDLSVFQETERFLDRKGFPVEQSLAQTQAIAQTKEIQSHDPASTPLPDSPSQQPSIQELRQWYKQARDLGRSEAHLSQIEQVGKAFAQGQPVSEQSLQAMAIDKAHWTQQAETIATQSRFILATVGQPLNGGTVFVGKQYTLYACDDSLYALANGRGRLPIDSDRRILPDEVLASNYGIILKQEQGEISTRATKVTSADAAQFERFAERVGQRSEVELGGGIDR